MEGKDICKGPCRPLQTPLCWCQSPCWGGRRNLWLRPVSLRWSLSSRDRARFPATPFHRGRAGAFAGR
jgi:hypothetical protein